jgi:oxygen-independent coproporphyrinogen-3 oxidase
MAGIYIHVPFCRKRCHYCDFFKSTDFSSKERILQAFKKELESRSAELSSDLVNTIYLGGGTPSTLHHNELKDILVDIGNNYKLSPEAEITMEANPDDLSQAKLTVLREMGYNRLSMGIQSFAEADLKLMNRRHGALQALQSVKWAKNAGFQNISIDLIYGLPNQSLEEWERNVSIAVELDVQHISAYHLTYHEGTNFYEQLKLGKLQELPDELSLSQFEVMLDVLKQAGFEHYEISNFCKPGFYSKHNSAYWKNEKYMGIGPSAHSFDLVQRRWNVSSIAEYLKGLDRGDSYFETEILSEQDRYNDYMITGLRTIWGISETYIRSNFTELYFAQFEKMKNKYLELDYLAIRNDSICLTPKGFFISDQIMQDFMLVN